MYFRDINFSLQLFKINISEMFLITGVRMIFQMTWEFAMAGSAIWAIYLQLTE